MTDIKPVADPMKNLQECIGRYGVQCSETKELAPSIELVNALADFQSAISQAREEGRLAGMREAAKMLRVSAKTTSSTIQHDVLMQLHDVITRAAEGK